MSPENQNIQTPIESIDEQPTPEDVTTQQNDERNEIANNTDQTIESEENIIDNNKGFMSVKKMLATTVVGALLTTGIGVVKNEIDKSNAINDRFDGKYVPTEQQSVFSIPKMTAENNTAEQDKTTDDSAYREQHFNEFADNNTNEIEQNNIEAPASQDEIIADSSIDKHWDDFDNNHADEQTEQDKTATSESQE